MQKLDRVTDQDTYPCIYLMINRINGMIYIGQTKKMYSRYIGHRKKKHGKRLGRAVQEHGFKSFDWYVLEKIEGINDITQLKKQLTEREQYYLDLFQSYNEAIGYNICPAADSTLGYKHTEESKRLIREKRALQNTWGANNPIYGTTRPDSVKIAISKAHTGKRTCQRAVKQFHATTGELIKRWDCATDAAKALNIRVTGIVSVCRKRPKWSKPNQRWYRDHTCGGFKWEYDGEKITGYWDKTKNNTQPPASPT